MYIRNETVTSQRPHADIRRALVEGIRNNPDKPWRVKHAAERLIGVIDGRGTEGAFQHAYAVFMWAAGVKPYPKLLTPAEIAKALGLGDHQ